MSSSHPAAAALTPGTHLLLAAALLALCLGSAAAWDEALGRLAIYNSMGQNITSVQIIHTYADKGRVDTFTFDSLAPNTMSAKQDMAFVVYGGGTDYWRAIWTTQDGRKWTNKGTHDDGSKQCNLDLFDRASTTLFDLSSSEVLMVLRSGSCTDDTQGW